MTVAMRKMYHPDLEPPGNVRDFPDDEDSIAVHKAAGWRDIPPEAMPADTPGVVDRPVRFVPVNAETGEPIDDADPVDVDVSGPNFAAVPVPGEPPAPAPVHIPITDRATLEGMTVPDLATEAGHRGLPKSGTKNELVDRLAVDTDPEE